MASPSGSPDNHAERPAGVITTTILRSPVVHSILHAKIRGRKCNDVVFVGHCSIEVKQVKEEGHLQHIITKSDFDSTIRAAKVFTIEADNHDEESIVKQEETSSTTSTSVLPLQCLVLTLDSNDILFLYLRADSNGQHYFVHQTFPMPIFEGILFQPGQHLAVDHRSRALAVAASEREIVIYSAKSTDRIQHELRSSDPDWCPVSAQRPIQIMGTIQQMDFLIPPVDDGDHVILLVLVVHDRRTKAIRIDWHYASDIHHAQIHEALPLDQPASVSGLLIPLRNAGFLLSNGSEIKRFDAILSGSIRWQPISIADEGATYPAESSRTPMWTNWCRPERGAGADDQLYLAREDGNVFHVQERGAPAAVTLASLAGNMGCNIGTAFASVGGIDDPDILVTAGDMSSGWIVDIGSRFTPKPPPNMSRSDVMKMDFVESIPNWASVTDMMVSTLPGKSQRGRDGLFVTSGRQPFGAVTELRYGLEAKLSIILPLGELGGAQNVWTLPILGVGHVLVILSGPGGTSFLRLNDNEEDQDEDTGVELLEPSSLDSHHETLLAVFANGKLVQVTNKTLYVTEGIDASFEDKAQIDKGPNGSIIAATCNIRHNVVITVERTTSASNDSTLVSYTISAEEGDDGNPAMLYSLDLAREALAVACVAQTSRTVAATSNVNGELEVFSVDESGTFNSIGQTGLPASEDGPSMCDSIVMLQPPNSQDAGPQQHCLIVCGLRDGRLFTVQATFEDQATFTLESVLEFGQSSVRLTQPADVTSIAYAMSGLDTCQLSWAGEGAGLKIESVWLSDKKQPELPQGAISSCSHTPSADLLSATSARLAESIVFISGAELLLGRLDTRPNTVPRQFEVSGTPNRLLYLEQQRCIACASLKYEVRHFASAPFERRQIWPVIDFIPSKTSAVSFSHDMQPGERVYALLEWSFRQEDDKVYSFLLVGGSYVSARSGSTRGRITFLQPTNRNWEVVGVKEGRQMKFDAPVYALALLDPLTFVACTGNNVVVCRFNTEDRKWQSICEPYELHSLGTCISVDETASLLITISTNTDSKVVLALDHISEADGGYDYKLQMYCTAPRADTSLHHLTLAAPLNDTTLLTTKNCKLVGLEHLAANSYDTSSRVIFEAALPHSFTRLRHSNVRPPWKPASPPGVLVSNIIGCSADGTITGIMLVDQDLWRRLSWLQRLCEWSEELSPHSYQTPTYGIGEETNARDEHGMPIGFGKSAVQDSDEVVMRTARRREQDRHIDGDCVARVLEHGGVECLRRMVREAAERDDAVGQWIRAHLEQELEYVEEMVQVVEMVVNGWL